MSEPWLYPNLNIEIREHCATKRVSPMLLDGEGRATGQNPSYAEEMEIAENQIFIRAVAIAKFTKDGLKTSQHIAAESQAFEPDDRMRSAALENVLRVITKAYVKELTSILSKIPNEQPKRPIRTT